MPGPASASAREGWNGLWSPASDRCRVVVVVEVVRFNIGLVLGCLLGGESGGMRGAEVGAVAGEREGPLLSGVVEILGDQVRGIGLAAACHGDVGRCRTGVFAQGQVGGSGGLSLGPVGGRGVGEFDVVDGVPQRKVPRARRPDEMGGAVVAHPGDGPGVALGHAEVVVVAPGSDK